jgi:O-methyltransferase involved in polyketide biosynthesis
MDLSQISRTAIFTLICRVIGTENKIFAFKDPMAVLCLKRLIASASEEDKRWINRVKYIYEKIETRDTFASVRRVKTFDETANRFIAENPGCTIVNLACGFDTRYWRLEHEKCVYIEIDLPEVVRIKKELLKEHLEYEIIGGSVLDAVWIDKVTVQRNTDYLLLAEGLFMYLSPQDAKSLLQEISEKFYRSQFVADMALRKYTKGMWNYFIKLQGKVTLGLNLSMTFGIEKPQDIEAYGKGFKIIGEGKGTIGPIIIASINSIK